MDRTEIRDRLAKAMITVEDPGVVFRVEPIGAAERVGGERLGRLLARLINDPDRGFIIVNSTAFIFAFVGQRDPDDLNKVPAGTPILVAENENIFENGSH